MKYLKLVGKHFLTLSFCMGIILGGLFLTDNEVEARNPCPDDSCHDGSSLCYHGVPGSYCDINSNQECVPKNC